MKRITGAIRGTLFAAGIGLLFSVQAMAATIPVGTTSADDLIINFNFSSATPAPPYTSVTTIFNFTGQTAGETVFADLFGGLNGTSFLTSTTLTGPGIFSLTTITGTAAITDGVYSYGFRVATGAVELTSFTATGTNTAGQAAINGTIAAVPEPGTFALLSLGLAAGLGFLRRKQ